MAKRSKAGGKSTARRDLFGELMEGLGALDASRGVFAAYLRHELAPGPNMERRCP